VTTPAVQITTSTSAHGAARTDIVRTSVFDSYLLGYIDAEGNPPAPTSQSFAPTVVSPTGEHFPLPVTTNLLTAMAAILLAAAHYTYQPHQLTISQHASRDDVLYYGDCPTCADAGRPDLPGHPTAAAAREYAVHDHQRVQQMTAVLTAHPRTLDPSDPPAQTRHPLARTGDPCPTCPEHLTADEARLARQDHRRTCSLCTAIVWPPPPAHRPQTNAP